MVRGWNRVTRGEPARKVATRRKVERNQACNGSWERGSDSIEYATFGICKVYVNST